MDIQGELFGDNWDKPPVGRNSPETSQQAADSISDQASRLAKIALAYISHNGGLTCAEVEAQTGMSHQTASARIWELQRKGKIKDSGQRRKTPSGRNAIVWVKTGAVQ